MATSTVLRVKRRREDNPQDALVLLCKRIKTDTEEISPSLFVFRATVDSPEVTNAKDIVPKYKLKNTHNVNDILQKIRKERKEISTESRYEVVNCSRGLNLKDSDSTEDIYHFVDLKPKSDTEEEDVQYAYDLYIAAKQDFDISMIDNLVSIENCESELIFGTSRDNGLENSDDEAVDDDDSNDENNWRNEYPEDEADSIDEEDMIEAMKKVDLDDLSSDEGEDKIYDDPPDIFNEDVKRYGEAYAKYKAKVISEEPDLADSRNHLIHYSTVKDLDEESVEGYKDDSDDGFYYGQDEDAEQFKDQYKDEKEVSSDEYSPD